LLAGEQVGLVHDQDHAPAAFGRFDGQQLAGWG
jgi:hypothetical protein